MILTSRSITLYDEYNEPQQLGSIYEQEPKPPEFTTPTGKLTLGFDPVRASTGNFEFQMNVFWTSNKSVSSVGLRRADGLIFSTLPLTPEGKAVYGDVPIQDEFNVCNSVWSHVGQAKELRQDWTCMMAPPYWKTHADY